MAFRTRSFSFLAAALVAACGSPDDTTGPGNGQNDATISGRVEQPAASGAAGAAVVAADASTVAAASVAADGSLTVLAEADVQADGTFRIENVATGRSDLVVLARSEADVELGRVLIHETTRAGTEIVVAPVNAETSVEGRAWARLRVLGQQDAAENTGELALLVRMDEAVAASVMGSDAQIDAVADAYAGAQAWLDATVSATGSSLDADTRAELTAELAADYALARDAGASIEAAHEAFVIATLDAYAANGADAESLTLLTAAMASGSAKASGEASSATRLELARQSAVVNLRARERLAASVTGEPGSSGTATASALASARAQVKAAADLTAVKAALDTAAETSEGAVFDGILEVTGSLGTVLELQIAAALSAAFVEADLAAKLQAAANAQTGAQVLADHRSDVRAAVDAVVGLVPDGVSIDAEALTELLIAAYGGAWLG